MHSYTDPDAFRYILVTGPADAGPDYWAMQIEWAKRAEKTWQEHLVREGKAVANGTDS